MHSPRKPSGQACTRNLRAVARQRREGHDHARGAVGRVLLIGRVLVADRENDRVQIFAQTGELIAQWPTKLIGPATFWVDRNDFVYVPEHNGGFFSVLTLDGEVLARWGSEQYRSCHSVAGDSDGNVYFVQHAAGQRDQGRRIVKYLRKP